MSQPPRRDIAKARWPLLSPLLDELLDLAPEQRPARLRELQDADPELAADLHELLWRQDAMEAANYLATPALQQLAQQPARAANSAGQQVGAYTLAREIGQGGMGTVWLARRTDGRFEGQVAIKFLNSGLLGQGDAGRFAREGQILARLAHPHIARLIDAGITAATEQPYLVLEYVDGLALDQFCESQALDTRARVALFQDVLAAVAHAHTRLILHRDLKPSNILVSSIGEVKLLDFGIAKLLRGGSEAHDGAAATEPTRQAGRAFTPRFAAPEQVQGGEVTTATDVYALGVLLYLLLSGQHPTQPREDQHTTPLERMRTVVEVEPKKLSERVRIGTGIGDGTGTHINARKLAGELRGDLDTIVAKALKKDPGERYTNAAELAEELRRWLAHEPISARPDSVIYILAKFVRRHRVAVAASSLGLLALLASTATTLWKAQQAHEQHVQAEGLIEFMLGDLRQKLEPVGRLDVLDAVGEKALAYYARQDLSRSDADSLGRRARALHLMGEIAEKRGHMAEAERRFGQAAQSTAELLARDPQNTQRLFDHAQSSYWVGYAAWQQRRMGEAEAGFQRYLALAAELVALQPDKPEWQIERAHAEQNMGVLRLRSGQAEAARTHLEPALRIWQSLLAQRPNLRLELATTLGWLAEAEETLGLLDKSIASHQAKLAALAPNEPQGPQDRNAEHLRAATAAALSRLYLDAGRPADALLSAQQARDSYAKLANLDPDNLNALARLAFARQQLSEVWLAQGEAKTAQLELARLGPELQRLLRSDAPKPAWRLKLRARWLSAMLASAAAPAERSARLLALTEFLDGVAAKARPDELDADTAWTLASAMLARGDALAPDDAALARVQWQGALAALAPIGNSTEARVIYLRALALSRLKRTEEALALTEKLGASAYLHPLRPELKPGLQSGAIHAPDKGAPPAHKETPGRPKFP